MSAWKSVRYRLEWAGMASLYRSIPLLPRPAAHRVACRLGDAAYHADKHGRAVALANLELVFGDSKPQEELRRIARESYRNFARTVVDQFWSPRLTRDNYEKYCRIEADDMAELEAVRETGAIWVTPHYSNFEWLALAMGFRGYHFTIVAQDFKNKSLTGLYRKNREHSGHEVIPQRGAIIRLLKNLKAGGHSAFLTDLTIRPSKAATVIECFGKKTCVTAIHAELMKRTGLPVIPGLCIPRDDGGYTFHGFRALRFDEGDTQQSIAQRCWDVFEPHIRENPAPWLWMYKHWRYEPKAGPEGYPFYVRPSEAFEAVEEKAASR